MLLKVSWGWPKMALIAAAMSTACAPDLSLVLQGSWAPTDPLVAITVDSHGLLRSAYLPPQTVRESSLNLLYGLDTLYLRSFPQLQAYEPFSGCSIELGGEGEPIEPQGAWRSGPITEDGVVVLAEEAPPRYFDLRLQGCASPPQSCALGFEALSTGPSYRGLRKGVALGDGRLIAAGFARGPTDPRTLILELGGPEARELGPFDGVTGSCLGLARHGDHVIGATWERWFELDAAGSLSRSATVGFQIEALSPGGDGSVGLLGNEGQILIMGRDKDAFEPLAGPPYGAPQERSPMIALRSPDSVLVVGPDTRLYLWEGGRWRAEFVQAESFDEIGAGADSFVVVPTRAAIHKRDADGAWAPLPPLTTLSGVGTSAHLDGGRFLFGAAMGLVLYWDGEQLCQRTTGEGRRIKALMSVPGSRVAWAVGDNDGENTPPLLLRIQLPE